MITYIVFKHSPLNSQYLIFRYHSFIVITASIFFFIFHINLFIILISIKHLGFFQRLLKDLLDSISTASQSIYILTNLINQFFQFVPDLFDGV